MESHYFLKILSIIIFFFTVIALVPIYAKKEFINDVPFKVDENLFIDIIKRLGNIDYPSERSDNSDLHDSVSSSHKQIKGIHSRQTCESTLRIGTIIKATESLSAGAAYIDSIKGVKSNDLCSEYCCRNISCDISVYQDKGDRFCYLFNCDGKCIFKEHVGYFVTNIKHDMSEHPAEEDLHNLNTEAQTNGLGKSEGNKKDSHLIGQEDGATVTDIKHEAEAQVVTEATPRIVVTQSPTEPQEPVITPHSVGLGGYCTQSIQCEDPNAGCLDHNCYCKNGYYNKDGLCRKVCSPSEFECFELGTLSRGPECVARSQVCDSYMQCADGSDEFNCDHVAASSQPREQFGSAWHKNGKSNSNPQQPSDPFTQQPKQQLNNIGQQGSEQTLGHKEDSRHPAEQSNRHAVEHPNNEVSAQSSVEPGNGQGNAEATNPKIEQLLNAESDNPSFPVKSQIILNANPTNPNHPNPKINLRQNRLNISHNRQTDSDNSQQNLSRNRQTESDNGQQNLSPNRQTESDNGQQNLSHNRQTESDNGQQNLSHNRQTESDNGQQNLSPNRQTESDNGQQNLSHNRQTESDNGQQNHHPDLTHVDNADVSPQLSSLELPPAQSNTLDRQGDSYPSHSAVDQDKILPPADNSVQFKHPVRQQMPTSVSDDSVDDEDQHRLKTNSMAQALSAAQKILAPPPSASSFKPLPKTLSSLTNGISGEDDSSSKTKFSSYQNPGKSHTSGHQTNPQKHLSSHTGYNPRKWLDPGLYMPYGLPDRSAQQQQPSQQSSGNQYLDSPQYYPPYSNDNLDMLPNSLLANIGSADDFSQFGGPYLGHEKSNTYQAGNQNSAYPGYPDTAYGSRYAPSGRYDYSGEYRSPTYQETEFYPGQAAYRPAAGVYEDFPSGQRLQTPNVLNKLDANSVHHSSHEVNVESNEGQTLKATGPKPTFSPTKAPPVIATNRQNASGPTTSTSRSPPPASTAKPGHAHRNDRVFMSSEKLIIASATSNAEGPIIALSLGLAFTVILLVLVGCRLRNVRHRLRKGRPLHQNEADYLINGMYL